MKLALPEPILARLKQGVVLAPSLREITKPDGTRYAVLDFIVQVPVTSASAWEDMHAVLRFD